MRTREWWGRCDRDLGTRKGFRGEWSSDEENDAVVVAERWGGGVPTRRIPMPFFFFVWGSLGKRGEGGVWVHNKCCLHQLCEKRSTMVSSRVFSSHSPNVPANWRRVLFSFIYRVSISKLAAATKRRSVPSKSLKTSTWRCWSNSTVFSREERTPNSTKRCWRGCSCPKRTDRRCRCPNSRSLWRAKKGKWRALSAPSRTTWECLKYRNWRCARWDLPRRLAQESSRLVVSAWHSINWRWRRRLVKVLCFWEVRRTREKLWSTLARRVCRTRTPSRTCNTRGESLKRREVEEHPEATRLNLRRYSSNDAVFTLY